jgi:hypothetical protein
MTTTQPAVTLFEVRFATAMDAGDLAVLARELDLSTNVRSAARPRDDDLGFSRLDHASGLFLTRSEGEGHWALEARTWGHPTPRIVHRWHVVTASAARLLDATVVIPALLADDTPDVPDRHVGAAANKRLSRLRRRLGGVS